MIIDLMSVVQQLLLTTVKLVIQQTDNYSFPACISLLLKTMLLLPHLKAVNIEQPVLIMGT